MIKGVKIVRGHKGKFPRAHYICQEWVQVQISCQEIPFLKIKFIESKSNAGNNVIYNDDFPGALLLITGML